MKLYCITEKELDKLWDNNRFDPETGSSAYEEALEDIKKSAKVATKEEIFKILMCFNFDSIYEVKKEFAEDITKKLMEYLNE